VVSILSNIALLAIAYGVASLFKLDHKTSKTIAIETSFQNNNLAFALAISVISIPIVGIPSLFYGLIMTVMGLVIVFIERYRHKRFHIPH
jgi:predicted Na+-dependent transporter